MDKLNEIFSLQKTLNELIFKRGDYGDIVESRIQKLTLATISELAELLDEVNFKWWKNPKPLNGDALKGEIIDILHFLVCMCLEAGMDADEVFTLYKLKNQENINRQRGKSDKQGYLLKDNDAK